MAQLGKVTNDVLPRDINFCGAQPKDPTAVDTETVSTER